MTKKDALAFLNRLSKDEALSKRVKATGKEGIAAIAREEGLSLTLEEIESVVREIKGSSDELSDDLLEMVVGGLSVSDIGRWVEENIGKLADAYDSFLKD